MPAEKKPSDAVLYGKTARKYGKSMNYPKIHTMEIIIFKSNASFIILFDDDNSSIHANSFIYSHSAVQPFNQRLLCVCVCVTDGYGRWPSNHSIGCLLPSNASNRLSHQSMARTNYYMKMENGKIIITNCFNEFQTIAEL